MAKKFTPMQELFRHEQQRLRRAIAREFRKTGVELDINLIPEMPSRVTQKQLENIKGIKPKDLRRETQYVDYETGEIIDYNRAKELWKEEQRVVTPQSFDFNNTVIDSYFDSISKYNDDFQRKIRGWVIELIGRHGIDAIAEMLMEGAENGVVITTQIAYHEAACSAYMSEMLAYLNPAPRTRAEILAELEASVGYEEPE